MRWRGLGFLWLDTSHSAPPPPLPSFLPFTPPPPSQDSCEREVRAVDSEFQRNLQSDQRRLFQLLKSTSAADHPFRKFSTGNLHTLTNASQPPHAATRAFYETHYIAPKSTLCVIGKESLDDLQADVLEAFQHLPAGIGPPPAESEPPPAEVGPPPAASFSAVAPLSQSQLGGLLVMSPVRESRTLRLMWPVPPEETFRECKSHRLLSSLLSHEREHGINWLLTRGISPPLATSFSAGLSYSMDDAAFFTVSAVLTPLGLEQYERVIELVYGAIHQEHNIRTKSSSCGRDVHIICPS
eukprot:190925-Pleurochrysis_carterae.AAC.1